MSLTRQVLRVIREHSLLGSDDRLAVAVSGGADSVGLLLILKDLEAAGDLPGRLAGLIHVNHRLRGGESDRDERFCRALAERVNLPIESAGFDVAQLAREAGRSIESAARDVRYRYFADAAARLGATRVATAHTIDDQAETVLLRLLRGSGRRGLAAIRVRRGLFIRPLLTCRRGAVREFLSARGEAFCEDSSNLNLDVPRNRLRHRLLPVIEELSPSAVPAIARAAALAAEDEAYLEQEAIKAVRSLVLINVGGVQLNAAALHGLPVPIGRRVIRRLLEELAPGRAFSSRHFDAVARLSDPVSRSAHVDLPGIAADREGDALALKAVTGDGSGTAGREQRVRHDRSFEVPLPVPGDVVVPMAGLHLTAIRRDQASAADLRAGGDFAVVQETALQYPLVVRNRRPGDRFRPLGAPGRRKLQDVFVDRKIPRGERDHVPLVVDAAGRIVWVAGVTIAEECRVTAPGAGMVVLKLERGPAPQLKGTT